LTRAIRPDRRRQRLLPKLGDADSSGVTVELVARGQLFEIKE
jgi:hypothetical protein